MGMGLSVVTRGNKRAQRRLKNSRSTIKRGLTNGIEEATFKVQGRLKRDTLRGRKGRSDLFGVTGAKKHRLGMRSGKTSKSVRARVFTRGDVVVGVVGSRSKVLQTHEKGGTIKGSPFLRIPTKFSQTGAGIDRNAGRKLSKGTPNTAVFPARSGVLFIWQVKPLRPLYLLKRSIKLRPRRMFKTTLRLMGREIDKVLGKSVRKIAVRLGGPRGAR